MPKPFPEEFRRDVVAVARKREAPLTQIAKDFGISEPTLHNWLKKADIEDGNRPGMTKDESAELREAKKRIRLLEDAGGLTPREERPIRPAHPRRIAGACVTRAGRAVNSPPQFGHSLSIAAEQSTQKVHS